MTQELPEKCALDHLRSLAKWVVSPASTTFDVLVPSPVKRREARWRESVEARLAEAKLDPAHLLEDEAWLTFFMQATRLAVETHEEQKLSALGEAVVNAGRGGTEDEWDIREVFLSRLAVVRAVHLRLLAFLDDPEAVAGHDAVRAAASSADRVKFVTSLVPELDGRGPLAEVLLEDLVRVGLLEPRPPVSSPRSGTHLTDLGRAFVAFVGCKALDGGETSGG